MAVTAFRKRLACFTEARIRVLGDGGYEVVAADTQADVLRFLRSRRVSLVVACHSVPPDERGPMVSVTS